jgi:hypothetical protein
MPSSQKRFQVRFRAAERKRLEELPLSEFDIGCMGGFREQPDGSYVLDAVVPESVLKKLKTPRVEMDVVSDLQEEKARAKTLNPKHVGRGNRYEGKDWIPRGLGKKLTEGDRS